MLVDLGSHRRQKMTQERTEKSHGEEERWDSTLALDRDWRNSSSGMEGWKASVVQMEN